MEKLNDNINLLKRPGGFEITTSAVSFCQFKPGAKILDIGCGRGATVRFLKNNFQLDAVGTDIEKYEHTCSERIINAPADNLPFAMNSLDGIFMECSFSLMEDQELVLKESFRVLKKSGYLIMSDLYAKGLSMRLSGCASRISTREEITEILSQCGFEILQFEDYTHQLRSMWAQQIMDMGTEAFYQSLGTDSATLKCAKCGYFQLIAIKSEES